MTEVKLNFQLNKPKNNILIKKIIKKLFFKNKIDYSNLIVEIDDRSREYVKSAGIKGAWTLEAGVLTDNNEHNRFRLPRYFVPKSLGRFNLLLNSALIRNKKPK